MFEYPELTEKYFFWLQLQNRKHQRKLKNPESVDFKSLLKDIDREMNFIERMKFVNKKKLTDSFMSPE